MRATVSFLLQAKCCHKELLIAEQKVTMYAGSPEFGGENQIFFVYITKKKKITLKNNIAML